VVFSENGLPTGTRWSITWGGYYTQSSTGTTITFVEPDGTYSYSIGEIVGWYQATLPYTGLVILNGSAITEPTLNFTQVNDPLWTVSQTLELSNTTPASDLATVAYGNGEVFVVEASTDSVSVISDLTNQVTATVQVGSNPLGLAYDGGRNEVFVADFGTFITPENEVSVVSTITNKVVATVDAGVDPTAVTYDPVNGDVYVVNEFSANVSVISDATNQVVATVAVGTDPDSLAYDSDNGEIYVSNWGSSNVTLISGATNMVVASVPVAPNPDSLAYDSGRGEVFVAALDSVDVISDTSNHVVATVPVGDGSEGWGSIAYDDKAGELFVTNWNSATVSVISDIIDQVVETVTVGSVPSSVAYDPSNGDAYIVNFGQGTVSLLSSAYPLRFTEAGLPTGALWSVTLNGTVENSTTSEDTFVEPNGTYDYTIADVSGWHQTTLPYTGSVTVNGATVTEPTLNFTEVTYWVTFAETGLPSETTWSVTLGGSAVSSTTSTITFGSPNGTYAYTITDVSGWHQTTLPYMGSVLVNGAGVTEPTLAFTQVTYTVTFTESGLPSGMSWSVTLGGSTVSSTTSTITITEPNGTYTYGANPEGAYYAQSGGNGTFTVQGAGRTFVVAYAWTVALTFTETGLPTESTWTVTVTSMDPTSWQIKSSASSMTFHLPANASYNYTITVPAGESVSTSSGSLALGDTGQAVPTVTVSPTSTSSSSFPWTYVIIGVAVVAVAVGVVIGLMRHRRPPTAVALAPQVPPP
jgi:YVTN family beta-propeller protein